MKTLVPYFFILQPSSFILSSRAAGIRTRDLLNPIQAHYQAVLRPVQRRTIDQLTSVGESIVQNELELATEEHGFARIKFPIRVSSVSIRGRTRPARKKT